MRLPAPFDTIENMEAITEEDRKKTDDNDDISSDSATERETEDKDPPETEGGSIKKAVEALAIPASTSGVVGTSESSSSSGTSSISTRGSSKSDISSSDSSDSSRSYSSDLDTDSDVSAADKKKKYKYNKMPSSSIIKSPVSDGSWATFEMALFVGGLSIRTRFR
jgi:hypothetical protein